MQEFALLDVSLIVCGSAIQTHSRCSRFTNLLFMTVTTVSYVATFVTHCLLFDLKAEPLYYASYFLDAVFGSLFISIMNKSRVEFQDILTKASKFLTTSQKQRLQRHSLFSLLTYVLILCLSQSAGIVHLTDYDAGWKHCVIDGLRYYSAVNGWYVTGILTFAFFVKVIRFRDENFFKDLEARVRRTRGKDLRSVIYSLRRETEFKNSITSAFSVIPVLWFAIIYAKVGMVYENGTNVDSITLQVMLRLFESLVLILLIVYLINLCEETTNAAKQRISAIVTILIEMPDSELELALQSEDRNFSFKIWSMFEISRPFGLSFLASVITFTVLFIQLSGNVRTAITKDPILA